MLLDAVCDPDAVGKHSSLACLPLLPAAFSRALARTNLLYNGANYQIQRLTLHLAASVQLRVSPAPLAAEFPLLSLSIDSRVPSCRIVTVTHFDEHTRRLNYANSIWKCNEISYASSLTIVLVFVFVISLGLAAGLW